jgi:lysophospholipase L1-like esterase
MKSRYQALALVFASTVTTLLLLEGAARIWVGSQWPSHRVYELTHQSKTSGQFVEDPVVGYWLTPQFESVDSAGRLFRHDEEGFRSPPIRSFKNPGDLRVVLMGASTVYGIWVDQSETSTEQLRRLLQSEWNTGVVEVVNAGVPGWTSWETVQNLSLRVLGTEPDVVVVVDGRNEIVPQLFNSFRDGYGHYRDRGKSFSTGQMAYKRIFWVSHLAMFFTVRHEGRFGFSWRESNPSYATIRYENQPRATEIRQNAADAARRNAYRQNLETIVDISRRRGIHVVLATIPFRASAFGSRVLHVSPDLYPVLQQMVDANNETVRDVAREREAALADAATLATEELLVDDCHFNAFGEHQFARLLASAVLSAVGVEVGVSR